MKYSQLKIRIITMMIVKTTKFKIKKTIKIQKKHKF